jgi:hypothetical protein
LARPGLLALLERLEVGRIEAKAPTYPTLSNMDGVKILRLDVLHQRPFADLQPFGSLMRRKEFGH